jgi:hypothetical protein
VDQQLAWLLLVLAPLLVVEVVALFHLFARRPDLSLAGKTAWAAGILLIPFVGVLAYALLRPPGPASGKATGEQASGSTMGRLRDLMAAHDSGAMDDAAYDEAKAALFGVSSRESRAESRSA